MRFCVNRVCSVCAVCVLISGLLQAVGRVDTLSRVCVMCSNMCVFSCFVCGGVLH